jgi:hypothetical protein
MSWEKLDSRHDRLNFIAKLFDLKLDNIIGKKPIPNHAASITPDLDPDVPPVQFPPLINGLEQNKVCISTDYLNRCKVDDPRAFIAPPGTKLLSYWGILPVTECYLTQQSRPVKRMLFMWLRLTGNILACHHNTWAQALA